MNQSALATATSSQSKNKVLTPAQVDAFGRNEKQRPPQRAVHHEFTVRAAPG